MMLRPVFGFVVMCAFSSLGCGSSLSEQVCPASKIDRDGDGIPNHFVVEGEDKCPDQRGSGSNGCPPGVNPAPPPPAVVEAAPPPKETKPPPPAAPVRAADAPLQQQPSKTVRLEEHKSKIRVATEEIVVDGKILFESGSARIDKQSDELIEAIAFVMNEHHEIDFIEVAGHADKKGTPQANRELTQARADAVVARLVLHKVDPHRLRGVGFAELCPIDPRDNEEAYERNRRVEFKILRIAGKPTKLKWGGCPEAQKRGMAPQPIPATAPKK